MAKTLNSFPGFENTGHPTLVRWAKMAEKGTLAPLVESRFERALDLLATQKSRSDGNAVTKEAKELLRQTRLFIVQATKFLVIAATIERRLKAAVQKKH